MLHGLRRWLLAIGVVIAGLAVFAATASASITPTVSTTNTAPLAAGQTQAVGLDLSFAPTSGDSPNDLAINLPPGLLANADIDNGGCLQTTDISDATCQIGSGTINATLDGVVPIQQTVGFYLVPAPSSADLAGLAVAAGNAQQIGTVAPITIRPSGNALGVGATISFVLPNTISGQSLSISSIDSTFTGMRAPTTCPSTPEQVSISANSYADSTAQSAAVAVPVTGCSSLPFAPKYSLSATKDTGNTKSLKVTTTITQAADESPDGTLALNFGLNSFQPALGGLQSLCSAGVSSGTCTPVGSVTANSPLYPDPLTGQAYLTGTITGLTLTIVFPNPFPLTLVGSVNLNKNITTFAGLPDIPLTSLAVTLNSGSAALFSTNCANPNGTSTANLTDQNGDESTTASASYTIANCPASSSSSSGSSGSGSGSSSSSSAAATPHISSAKITGLKTGKPKVSFTATRGKKAANLKALTVTLPKGLKAVAHKKKLSALTIKGGKLTSAKVQKGKILITLKKAVKSVKVTIGSKSLKESAALKKKAKAGKKKLTSLKLTVVARNAKGKRTTIHVKVTKLGL